MNRRKINEAITMIDMAICAYKDKTPPSDAWECLTDTNDILKNQQTSLYAVLYKKKNAEQYVLAFRGLSEPGDLKSIFTLAVKGLPKQHDEAVEFAQTVMQKYQIKPQKLKCTGHSLGGYLAKTVGATINANHIWDFNSPGIKKRAKNEIVQRLESSKARHRHQVASGAFFKKRITAIHSSNDLISCFGEDEGQTHRVNTRFYHHGINSLKEIVAHYAKLQRMGADHPLNTHFIPLDDKQPPKNGRLKNTLDKLGENQWLRQKINKKRPR